MQSVVTRTLRQANRQPLGKLNILTACAHERYESNLALTGHNFYSLQGKDLKQWNTNYAPVPHNYSLVTQVSPFINIDLILSHHKYGHFQFFKRLSNSLQIPLIQLEHTLPAPNYTKQDLAGFANMRGQYNVFISEYSSKLWGQQGRVIHHGVDTQLFNTYDTKLVNQDNVILSVVNQWIEREWCCNFTGWQRITEGLPVRVVGDTPGLSKPAKDTQELASIYASSSIFLNTSTVSPIPYSLLEAMSAGCACVSTATCMIPEIIEHGVNGFISNDEKELRGYLDLLLNNKRIRDDLGKKARETIWKKFSLESFISQWNDLFEEAAKSIWSII